jgi:hypothetical protein
VTQILLTVALSAAMGAGCFAVTLLVVAAFG